MWLVTRASAMRASSSSTSGFKVSVLVTISGVSSVTDLQASCDFRFGQKAKNSV